MATLEEIEAELQRRGETTSRESVMSTDTSQGEISKFAESFGKGIPKGLIDLVGGWGNLYDYVKQSKDPSAFSSAGIMRAIKDLTGTNLQSIPGYRGAYEFSSAGAPAAVLTGAGLPGLFRGGALGTAGEFAVGGTTGVLASQLAPESPLAQLTIQAAPYALKGAIGATKSRMLTPEGASGMFTKSKLPSEAEIKELLRVGRLTPGEASLIRTQLAKEARVEAAPESGGKPLAFRMGQAQDTESFLVKLFDRASKGALTPEATTTQVVSAFNNYGKSLTSKLRQDAKVDFTAAKKAGGVVDTSPIISAVESRLAELPVETPGLDSLRASLTRIVDEYAIPETKTVVTPSTIVGPTGQPASVNITPGTPAQALKIDIDRLQKNLSTWSDAVYSGKADFGKGNIFEGVAPGQAKGVAMTVLNGFRDALTKAIDDGVPGADKLKGARDKFAANIKKIEEFSERPLTKAFDVANVSELVPENVMAKLKDLPPSQRSLLIDVMQNSPNTNVNGVLNSIRFETFKNIMDAAQIEGAPARSPTFSISAALREMDAKSGKLAELFPNKADLKEAELAMRYMQRVLSSESGGKLPSVKGGAIYATARGMGATATGAMAARETIPMIVKDLIASPKAMADVIFNPENRKALLALSNNKTVGKKALDAFNTLSKVTVISAVRGAPMSETTQPQLPSDVPPPDGQDQLRMIEEELRTRGEL
jgi:hypothetical protein